MPRPFDYHRLVVGYHGCDRSVGENALLGRAPLEKKRNDWDWLGEGIYFWEHGPDRAWEWARWKQDCGDISEAFVVGAYIHLGQCFDLTDTFATLQLRGFYDALEGALRAAGKAMPENRKAGPGDFDLVLRYLDCAVLNFGFDRLEHESPPVSYDTVRGVFPEGDEAFPGAKILTKTHVQVAVRNPECILGYFRPAR